MCKYPTILFMGIPTKTRFSRPFFLLKMHILFNNVATLRK
ncbi:hypothetical protein VAE122_2910114 [Vibrio aestuarianus]|nr:hypothetical protein VAE122_2910114 [Vibrio aestuarianus]